MNTIAMATDFSGRSDRALHRAALLAKQYGADMVIFHVVDDDQPKRLMKSQLMLAQQMIDSLSTTIASTDGVPCRGSIYSGAIADTVVRTVKELEADLLVIGQSRPQRIRNLFAGTVAERVIRDSTCPVLMTNGVPSAPYVHILVATDMSIGAEAALAAAGRLGLFANTLSGVIHAFDAPAYKLLIRSSTTKEEVEEYVESERSRARRDLQAWLEKVEFAPDYSVVEFIELTPSRIILDCVRVNKVDLVVVGITGKSALSRFMLGSVADEVLRNCRVDVLTG